MKKRIVIIIVSLFLVTVMLVTSSGCSGLFGKEEASETESDVVTKADDSEGDTASKTDEATETVTDEEREEGSATESEDNNEDSVTDTEEETEKETEKETEEVLKDYNTEAEDLGGFVLDVLTVVSGQWNTHTDLAPTTVTGETINRAVFQRNNKIQKDFNARIVAHEDAEYYGMSERLLKDLISGEYKYDAAYSEGSSVISLITQDALHNLYDLSEIQLDESWWSQLIKKEATIGSGKYSSLFFTQSNLSLTAFDLTWCVYFNKTAHETNQIEDLYELVDNNAWTIEKMKTISRNVASLNSDSNYT